MTDDILYLSEADVGDLEIDPAKSRNAILSAFREHHAGRIASKPKLSLDLGPGHKFQSLCAASAQSGLAVNKWLGVAPLEASVSGRSVQALVTLNDYGSGAPLCIMDGNVLTELRTAAMSAAMAEMIVTSEPRSIGFIGSGYQARSHLTAFLSLFPSLELAMVLSRTQASSERFANWAQDGHGLRTQIPESAEDLVRQSSILVTTVPMSAGLEPFLQPEWVAPGAFVSAVDLARSWCPETLSEIEYLVTDDHVQEQESPTISRLRGFDADLGDVASEAAENLRQQDRRMFIFRGHATADLAIASEIYRDALRATAGIRIPR
ncbi:hypothetical protein [Inquilinus sp. CAU 1745]|uniref:hypothetical protein n=1 Tax=Inquilinus sp. CAU 1745 TaxID=3140369 RepID=UPI00325BEACF